MALIDRLELRFSRYAIPGLIRYVVIFNALLFILGRVSPGYLNALTLDPEKIMQGEVWRLITYIFIPQTTNFLFAAMAVMFLWFVGDSLENTWGAFRLNVFYFTGIIFNTIAAFFLGGDGTYLNFSLLLAFATLFPDEVVLLLIIPMKVKWLAWIYVVLLVVGAITQPIAVKAGIVVSLFNYFLFFGPTFFRNRLQRGQAIARKAKFEAASLPEDSIMHRCAVCGRTDVTHPHLDFRVSADGNDYCVEHLPKKTPAS
jgi:membrane associated rhomboid family serine protease